MASKNKQKNSTRKSGLKLFSKLSRSTSPKVGMLTFAIVFAVIGGGYAAYKSFAASVPSYKILNLTQFPLLQQGNVSPAVRSLRRMLGSDIGSDMQNLSSSETFDAPLTNLVKSFQTFYHLQVDGKVGPQTWSTLIRVDYNLTYSRLNLRQSMPTVTLTSGYGGYVINATCSTGDNQIGQRAAFATDPLFQGDLTDYYNCNSARHAQWSSYNSPEMTKGSILVITGFTPIDTPNHPVYVYLP